MSLSAAPVRPFRLTRWFALVSLGSIALLAVVSATLLSRFMAERMLHRTGEVTAEFVQSLIRIHDGNRFFLPQADSVLPGAPRASGPAGTSGASGTSGAPGVTSHRGDSGTPPAPDAPDARRLDEIERIFGQVARMPDVLHCNLYDAQRRVVWSTNRDAIGRTLPFNPELAEALAGEMVVESDILNPANYIKPEHVFLKGRTDHPVENYIPVFADDQSVIGVVELYVSPKSLFEDIQRLTQVIWIASAGAGAFLFLVLLGLVRRADALIRVQQGRLVASESMAAVGEMASAVAHGIRNPLAGIRSSAELIAVDDAPGLAAGPSPQVEQAIDIIRQVDRLEGWVRQLLAYAYQGSRALQPVDVNAVLRTALSGFEDDLPAQRVALDLDLSATLAPIAGEPDSLEHVFVNLISNAIDAMPDGGRLGVSTRESSDHKSIEVSVRDSGIGMSRERLARIFVPFHTTKRTGLGVGTPLVKRTVERLGGRIDVTSRPGAGTVFVLHFPKA